MKRPFALLLLLFFSLSAGVACAETRYEEGKDYHRIMPPLPAGGEGKVEVVAMFWYGCPHCFRFDPDVKTWLGKVPDYVDFKQMPAIFNNPDWHLHATAFYTIDALGMMDTIHQPLFDAMHVQRKQFKTRESLQTFFEGFGVSAADFDKAFNSFAVKTRVNRAADISAKSGITGVPVMLVNGKYRIDGPTAGSYERLLQIVSYLVEQEHQNQP
ncbi:MAG: thiol:disulfide interchange protein DsbA/DsbL [Gammaproteobacteria bacterium]|nr:thiol:disulfide interchange protein DsbA/DsbL [Gammaproteobacteria bacterium]